MSRKRPTPRVSRPLLRQRKYRPPASVKRPKKRRKSLSKKRSQNFPRTTTLSWMNSAAS